MTGRAYPDIAAQGEAFRIFLRGEEQGISGTSASCPTVAAVISLVNDALMAEGKSPLGFLYDSMLSTSIIALMYCCSGTLGFTRKVVQA